MTLRLTKILKALQERGRGKGHQDKHLKTMLIITLIILSSEHVYLGLQYLLINCIIFLSDFLYIFC